MTIIQAPHHRPPDPPQTPPPARAYARTKATRLLSAGTYLDPGYRKAVIRELVKNRFRVVAPSYGYDAVSVLAHALAARRLRRLQLWLSAGSVALLWILRDSVNLLTAVLLMCWAVWALAYLRRIATLHILMGPLKETGTDGGFDGAYPANRTLTAPLIHKIDSEQSASESLVFYGGFVPFVGAGYGTRDWANAQLLIGARKLRVTPKDRGANGEGAGRSRGIGVDTDERKPVVPFTVDEITGYVARRMAEDLRERARHDERIEGLTVERRRFTTAVRTNDRTRSPGWSRLPGLDDLPDVHWREDYDAAREYLCVRIGSWNEELVTSIFVGFDLKGSTLHTEFYPHVLGPLVEDFHLVDRLPDAFDGRLAVRVAWDMVTSAPLWVLGLGLFPLRAVPDRYLPSGMRSLVRPGRRGSALSVGEEAAQKSDSSELRLGRYVTKSVNCGALTSVREMATNDHYHHFFQRSDALKYTQIVERRLLEIIRTFLDEHNVDLTDHDRAQNNILNYEDKSMNVSGGNNRNFSYEHGPSDGGSAGSQGE
ncbi:hypothetical protein [Actinacidiphila bryophytorum]|uniref:Uncharacterized protein n=1 Tax=Actinacidiphila bryophytorum TaxID=1436133 RepID=A0A9W4H3W4_9ACTN|nr:hypothetical protein [Actinacidiphila bryophytorum]CAG7648387.1 conserved hypothetical protein [Actinacidiphila bryophytorum]